MTARETERVQVPSSSAFPRLGTQRRSAEERAAARLFGVDRYGFPTARKLGYNPRQIRKRHPELSPEEAVRVSIGVMREARLAYAEDRPTTGLLDSYERFLT